MIDADHLIVGGGPAGCRAALAIRQRLPAARVVLVTEEPDPFPNRILLSKAFLSSDPPVERAVALPAAAFERAGVEVQARCRVLRLDPESRTAQVDDGRTIAWERCLVATGARPLTLPIPGFGLPGVHVLRTIADATGIREAAKGARAAVVVGGGLLGAEVACALAARGLAVSLVARETWLLGHLAPEPVGRAVGSALERAGIRLHLAHTVVAIGREGEGLRVETAEGEALPAPFVVAGVGVRPNTEFLTRPDLLDAAGAVRTDERLATKAPGLWAAGDVAAYRDPLLGGLRHRVEHWLHAQHQGRVAGENMTGAARSYARVSSYDTRLLDVSLTAIGATDLADRWSVEEPFDGARGTALGWRADRLVAAFRLGGSGRDLVERIQAGVPGPG